MRLLLWLALASVAVPAFATPRVVSAESIMESENQADALIATDRAFALAGAKDSAPNSLAALFSADVIMPIRGKDFARGKAAVVEALRSDAGLAAARVDWAPVGVGISADGTQGFTYGFMTEYRKGDEQILLKYLAYWRHDPSGWHVIAYNRSRRADGPIDTTVRAPLLSNGSGFAATSTSRTEHAHSLVESERAFSNAAQLIGLERAFAKFGTNESMNLGGGGSAGFVFGASAIATLVGQGEPEKGSSVSWAADERVVVADSGDLGLSVGHIRVNAQAGSGDAIPPIPFFTIWRRADVDQPWRYVAE